MAQGPCKHCVYSSFQVFDRSKVNICEYHDGFLPAGCCDTVERGMGGDSLADLGNGLAGGDTIVQIGYVGGVTARGFLDDDGVAHATSRLQSGLKAVGAAR